MVTLDSLRLESSALLERASRRSVLVSSLSPFAVGSPVGPPVGPSVGSPYRSVRMVRAKAARDRLKALFARRHRDKAAIAHELAAVKREKLYEVLGYTSVVAFASAEYGRGKSWVSELIEISTKSEDLPQIRAAFDSGELPWTKARELVKVATPETEADWLKKAETLDGDGLRAARGGKPAEARRSLSFAGEELAE